MNLKVYVMEYDILYVGGGNIRNMFFLWKEWGFDIILKEVYKKGIILVGISVGLFCWFEEGIIDLMNNNLFKIDCLGFLIGSNCFYYDGESNWRFLYYELMVSGKMKEGYVVDDGVVLYFKDEKLFVLVSLRLIVKVYVVDWKVSKIIEYEFLVIYLGDGK